ncbi:MULTISPECIES: hypothetical protein [Streptomyces]|uniref:Uncharacterized protein n=1 Tax=Streptomyces venezuelae TaxID=54571 RepID=A0A5P2B5E1_STRVZ|nr:MULTISPECIES: hypothetical protein [Streptomyces]MYY80262.1 hypothetical protein [Streptomyces sp. SID335]MYZ15580.1 hypothetical protein [Streptomyces sp. SID337]NEB49928.1 hypothetical protein [Streptomyces sp. SID339]QES25217.1 hypothetical protein DEJ47_00970 [Streptomyces venezuelae]
MPGTVLLVAAAPVGKGRLVDAASVLPVLAAVPTETLAGTPTASIVELADPLDPQTVLTRLRAAATTPGHLTVYLIGQVHLDRRQRQLHVALARTTTATVRYTGFPWHWFAQELRHRPSGSTTVIADLHADTESWQVLTEHPLDAGPGVALHGRVAPPARRRTPAIPAYMKAVATILRSGHRPPPLQLHQQAAAQGLGDDAPDLLPFHDPATPPAPHQQPAQPADAHMDPHAAITAAVEAGRHGEAASLAASWEQSALRMHGPGSKEVIHWMEVRADLARFAGDPARSCETWLAVASARLTSGQAPDSPEVEAAADRAHHLWDRIKDAEAVRALGPALVSLRRQVPGRQRGTLLLAQRRLEQFHAQEIPRIPAPGAQPTASTP